MAQRLLEGEYENVIDMKSGASDEELRQLRQENRRLDEALHQVRNELGQALADKENLERSIRALRNQLSPLHRYLRALFGEIELAVGEEEAFSHSSPQPPAAPLSSPVRSVWESWIAKLGGKQGDFIRTLLEHGAPMTAVQLKVATHSGSSTVSETVRKLQDLGLLDKNGSMYSLKRL